MHIWANLNEEKEIFAVVRILFIVRRVTFDKIRFATDLFKRTDLWGERTALNPLVRFTGQSVPVSCCRWVWFIGSFPSSQLTRFTHWKWNVHWKKLDATPRDQWHIWRLPGDKLSYSSCSSCTHGRTGALWMCLRCTGALSDFQRSERTEDDACMSIQTCRKCLSLSFTDGNLHILDVSRGVWCVSMDREV